MRDLFQSQRGGYPSGVVQQQGAALLVALIMLLLVTLIGVSALKSGIFHERMAYNAQAKELTFQAAETGINTILSAAEKDNLLLTKFRNASESTPVNNCVAKVPRLAEGVCGDGQRLDARGSITANTTSHYEGKKPFLNTDAGALVDYQFKTIGEGALVQADVFNSIHHQQWRKVGPANQFSDDLGLIEF